MSDRSRSFTSSSDLFLPCHRSHSYRERTTRTADDLHHKKIQRIQRHYEQELDRSQREHERELQWVIKKRSDSFASPTEHLENMRAKLKNRHNQLMKQKVEEVEEYVNQRCDEERRLSKQKFRKAQIANEKFRLQSINEIVREQDAICQEKLAAQRCLYDRLLEEQAQRLHFEKRLQSFDNLNVEQLKDRLSRVEDSNQELKQLIRYLIDRKPIYKSGVYISHLNN